MGHARQPAIPAVYGRYQTLFRIAAGGMAEVYAARVQGEAGFQKLVALKRMLPHLTDDERFVTMFMDEGKLAANIESPNVVSTLDLGRAQDGSLYLVMELVVGTTLSTLLRNAAKAGESIDPDIACEIIAQAAQGLHDAHEARTPFGAPLELVHRDVSPQNILVGVDGRVRITDFGVARAVLRRTKTSTGEFKGKLSYFSPEQCADKDLDRRSDLFSLGVVAWETLTTRRLFHAENPLAVLERVTRMPIPSAHTVRTDIPPSVAAVVAMALERDRDARYDTAAEFGHTLRGASRDAYGTTDRGKISELVERFGGQQLDRIQTQLRESLANPMAFTDEAPESMEPTEVSSGIVMRPDEFGPATPKDTSGSLPRLEYSPDTIPAQPPASSRTPMIVAVIVALLGMGGGAVIGLVAAGSDDPVAPPAPALEVAAPANAEGTDPAAGGSDSNEPDDGSDSPEGTPPENRVEGAEPATPEESGGETDEGTEPAVEPATARPRRRGNRRRGNRRGGAAATTADTASSPSGPSTATPTPPDPPATSTRRGSSRRGQPQGGSQDQNSASGSGSDSNSGSQGGYLSDW